MSTLLQIYQQVCTEDLIPLARRKDVLTAVRYLAAAHDSPPDHLTLTPEIEATYRDVLRHSLTAQRKGPSTIRNSIQGVGQFLKAFHRVVQTPPVPVARPTTITYMQALKVMNVDSPYKHSTWFAMSPYHKPLDQWPSDLRLRFETYQGIMKDYLRPVSLNDHLQELEAYIGYLSMTAKGRLDHLPPEARKKLMLKRYKDDLKTITTPPVLTGWSDLFVKSHAQSFVTWHSWRIHTASDARVRERPPSKPSTLGRMVAILLPAIANILKQTKQAKILSAYAKTLPKPRKIHNKAAECHRFSFAELEQVALALIHEARSIKESASIPSRPVAYPGSKGARRFQIGLVLMLSWRIPMRARNWCEALIGTNLRQVNGKWVFHFEGNELKIGTKKRQTNVYEMEVPPDVVPYLEEYLHVWRPKLPQAGVDVHFLLAMRAGVGMLQSRDLSMQLKAHVYRYTGKRFYLHLTRTIFASSMLSAGMDINSVAYGLNDNPVTVLQVYNELQGGIHQQNLQVAYAQALHGNGTANGKGTTP